MADEIIFDLLHYEIVGHLYRNSTKEDQDQCIAKLESLGFRVGQSLVERYVWASSADPDQTAPRSGSSLFAIPPVSFVGITIWFTKDCTRFKDELDTMKFICKDFWNSVFKKQVDNLRTNHQGVYVLQDNKFRFLTQISNGKQYMEAAPKFLAMACGMIRGALANIGVNSVVTAEVSAMPACKFQIQIQRT